MSLKELAKEYKERAYAEMECCDTCADKAGHREFVEIKDDMLGFAGGEGAVEKIMEFVARLWEYQSDDFNREKVAKEMDEWIFNG